ncbi:hypothetical protein [Flavobacterium flavigenum]|uniref:hypothetical protein n=1 Tax=Flavobacterium flavigenum TaxID=3003258 RepID=UPI00248266F8|nr:hypothetical protein [Flavobacterium flavigenum]
MMNKILTLLLFCFLFSCEKKEPAFSKEMIEILSERGELKNNTESLPPPPISFSDVYLLTNNDEVVILNENELFFFYKKDYYTKFKSFKEFLNAVLNNGFVVEKKMFKHPNYPRRFKLNSKIKKEYSDLGFHEFLKKYSKLSSRKVALELNKSIIKSEEYLTITYLLYKNKYDMSRDCYLGKDYVEKRVDAFR